MDSPPLFKLPQSPSTPLFPLSPERVNRSRPPYGSTRGHARVRTVDGTPRMDDKLPQSPSLPQLSSSGKPFVLKPSSPQRDSDANVQGMVARFNSLEIRDSSEFRRQTELVVKRAETAREMAELDANRSKDDARRAREEARLVKEEVDGKYTKLKEGYRRLHKDFEESKDRERKLARRMEAMMEDYQSGYDRHMAKLKRYEEEVKKLRKESLKTSSVSVKLQEELKSTRATLHAMRTTVETEKGRSARKEQETFDARYELVGVQEALDKAREQIKLVEEERDALKTSLKEEEVARIAAEGRIALPVSNDDDEFSSPKKAPSKAMRSSLSTDEDKENLQHLSSKGTELRKLQGQFERERHLRIQAESMIDFMKIECQFGVCSCRVAEKGGHSYVHDNSLAIDVKQIRTGIVTPPTSSHGDHVEMELDEVEESVTLAHEEEAPKSPEQVLAPEEAGFMFSPNSGPFRSMDPEPTETAPAQSVDEVVATGSVEHETTDQVEDADEVMEETEQAEEPQEPEETPDSAFTTAVEVTQNESNDEPVDEAPIDQAPVDEAIIDEVQVEESSAEDYPAEEVLTEEAPVEEIPADVPHTTVDEDVIDEGFSDDEDDEEVSIAPSSVPQTPANHAIRTITTTTTIPIAFSPVTPAAPHTPATVGHAPTDINTMTPISRELKDLPFDREAALEAIRRRRGRARSMAAGQATPRKQMMEGVARRDISAPTLKTR